MNGDIKPASSDAGDAPTSSAPARVGRRAVLAGAGAAAALTLASGTVDKAQAATTTQPADVLPFRGAHQTGIALPRQTDTVLAAFDLTTTTKAGLRALLNRWTIVAEALTQGIDVPDLPVFGNSPADPGETWGFTPHNLTITVGIGHRPFIGKQGAAFGLTHKRPRGLAPLPAFQGDALRTNISHGDFVIQACADNAAVAAHAVRQLARAANGAAKLRWLQSGAAPATPDGSTGRNLFGFMDGTATIKPDDLQAQNSFVWTQHGDVPTWLVGGSFLVLRRIFMELQGWDSALIDLQEAAVGRAKATGAPLSGGDENTPVDLNKSSASGHLLVPFNSHVSQSHPSRNNGVRLLRRGYGYTNGVDAKGVYDAGLLFMAFVRDVNKHYVPMQRQLAASDALTRWSHAIGSGVYAIFPGLPAGKTWADQLLG